MQIVTYKPTDEGYRAQLRAFLQRLYHNYHQSDFYLVEYEAAYRYCVESPHIQFIPFLLYDAGVVVGHAALIIDDRLPPGEAFFGFFEIIEDEQLFNCLWQELIQVAKVQRRTLLKGPINGSVWHQYRCIKISSPVPYFKTEPMTPLYYYDFFQRQKPAAEITYSSGQRTSFAELVQTLLSRDVSVELAQKGFHVMYQTSVGVDDLRGIAAISQAAFDVASWAYTSLDPQEFAALYSVDKINVHLGGVYLMYHQTDLVGYCSTIQEDNRLVCKTICLKPAFQGIGLGQALALKIHQDAVVRGVTAVVYALVRDGNQVHNYPTADVTIFRRYAAFEFLVPAPL